MGAEGGVRLTKLGLCAVAVACSLVASAPASAAKIKADDITTSTVVGSSLQIPFMGFGGGFISCPSGKRALTGGAYWNTTNQDPQPGIADQGYLGDSTVTDDRKGWYADGFHRSDAGPLSFSERVRCLPQESLEGSKLSQKTVSAKDFKNADALAKCPSGTRVYTGGSYFHKKGEGPSPPVTGGSRLTASFPTKNRKGWYAGGSGGVPGKASLTVLALCLPNSRFGHVNVVTFTQVVDSSQDGGGVTGCPANTAALTGGAYWRKPGKDVEHSIGAGILSGSSFNSNSLGWYVGAQSAGDGHKLTTIVHCVGS